MPVVQSLIAKDEDARDESTLDSTLYS